MNKLFSSHQILAVIILVLMRSSVAAAPTNLELIIDASGSMAAKIGGQSKMEIAKQALNELLFTLPKDTNIAVRAYGHRSKSDCADIQLLANFGAERSAISLQGKCTKAVG